MSKLLITIHSRTLYGAPTECINARDLHGFLVVGRRFATWITDRIKQYEFEKSFDYIIASQNGEAKIGRGGHNAVDYFISLDMAKELSMVERNEKGREARRYFIECEKKLRQEQHNLPINQGFDETEKYAFLNAMIAHMNFKDEPAVVPSSRLNDLDEFIEGCCAAAYVTQRITSKAKISISKIKELTVKRLVSA